MTPHVYRTNAIIRLSLSTLFIDLYSRSHMHHHMHNVRRLTDIHTRSLTLTRTHATHTTYSTRESFKQIPSSRNSNDEERRPNHFIVDAGVSLIATQTLRQKNSFLIRLVSV